MCVINIFPVIFLQLDWQYHIKHTPFAALQDARQLKNSISPSYEVGRG